MADFLDFLDPVAADAFRRSALARQAANDPTPIGTGLSPEEETTWLSRRLDEGLGGVSYLGKLLDKTFGGRAIRAGANMLAGGQTDPTELLSFLPGSDTLGITQDKNTVQGTDVLQNAGLLTKGDDGWENQLAGFGAELALDPSTFLGIGALTKGGQAAAKAGTLAGKTSERIAAGQAKLLDFGFPLQKTLFGIERTPFNLGSADTSAAIARNFLGVPLQAADYGARVAEKYIGGAAEKAIGMNPITKVGEIADAGYRQLTGLFDNRYAQATSKAGQALAKDFYTPRKAELVNEARVAHSQVIDAVNHASEGDPVKRAELERYLRRRAEQPDDVLANLERVEKNLTDSGMEEEAVWNNVKALLDIEDQNTARFSDLPAKGQPGWIGPEGQKVEDLVTGTKRDMEQMLAASQEAGVPIGQLMDLNDYMFRQRQAITKPGETLGDRIRRIGKEFSVRSEAGEKRLDAFRSVPGGTDTLQELSIDPRLSGKDRSIGGAPTTDLQAKEILSGVLYGKPADELSKVQMEWVDGLSGTLKTLDPAHAKMKIPLFRQNFAEDVLERKLSHAKTLSSAETLYEGFRRHAVPLTDLPEGQRVPLEDILSAVGMKIGDGAKPSKAQEKTLAAIQSQFPNADMNSIKQFGLPSDLAKDMVRFGQAWADPNQLKPILGVYDALLNTFKTGVTTLFPAFHTRNMMSGLFNAWRDEALSASTMTEANKLIRGGQLGEEMAGKLYPGLDRAAASREFQKELVANRIYYDRQVSRAGEQAGDAAALRATTDVPILQPEAQSIFGRSAREKHLYADPTGGSAVAISGVGTTPPPLSGMTHVGTDAVPAERGVLRQFFSGFLPTDMKASTLREEFNPFNIGGVRRDEDVFKPVAQMRKVGHEIEGNIRIGHYMEKRLQGFDPVQARDAVNRFHIDYHADNFTPFENSVMKRLVPWYSYSRKNLPPILEQLATEPGKITGATRLISGFRDPNQFTPTYIGEGAAIPLPGAAEGQSRALSSFGLPMEDELIRTIGSVLRGDVQRTFQGLVGQANPLVKVPFEQATGVQMFSGRKLQDLKPSESISLGGLLPTDIARGLTEIVSNSPLSRAVHTADTFLDPRKDIAATLLNLGTGLRVTDYDTAAQQDIAARQLVKDNLRGTPGIRTREEVYAPVNERGNLDANQMFMLEMLKSTDRRLQERAKLEKAMGPKLP